METRRLQRLLPAAVVGLACVPALALAVRALRGSLGANPVETLTHETGEWTLRFLLACLAVTPLRRSLRWPGLAPYRRTFGLLAFAYACLHFSTWLMLDLAFDLTQVLEDVVERPYITAGFGGFLLLCPLALTSTRGWQRRLGRRWLALHRLAYAAGVLGVLHFLWLVKADLREPLVYASVLAGLLLARALRLGRTP
ncbi:MAG: sulfoxide reductase heme-binding subunit YedZ [Proteobacteria bacterium]|nr:sulfoxide reductase heme-binding subunit YedZ [Pseudomonadota bacterium]